MWCKINTEMEGSLVLCGLYRLFAHQDDADIDDPYVPPQGHTLGQGTQFVAEHT